MPRTTWSTDRIVDALRKAVIADIRTDANLKHCSVGSLGGLMVTARSPVLPKGNGANWKWDCPGAPDAVIEALTRHARKLQGEVDAVYAFLGSTARR